MYDGAVMGKKKKHISEQILDKWIMFCERKKRSCFSYQIEKELGSLNPGINKDKMVHNFYQDKIKCGLLVLGFGGICVMGCIGNGVLYGDLEKERYLEREESGIRTIVLDAQIGNEVIEDVLIEIDAKKRTDAEVKKILEEAAEELEEAIKGENENLQEVRHPLCLINVWETADINIFWTSSNYGLIQEDGSFGEDSIPKEGEEVRLTAVLSCQELQIKKEISVKVFPKEKTEKERIKDELLILVEQQKDKSKSEEYLELPSRLDNTEIIWKARKRNELYQQRRNLE